MKAHRPLPICCDDVPAKTEMLRRACDRSSSGATFLKLTRNTVKKILLLAFGLLLAACSESPDAAATSDDDEAEIFEAEIVAARPDDKPLTFPIPRHGSHHIITPRSETRCDFLRREIAIDLPAGASTVHVSATGKSLCYALDGDTFCHTNGTGTGFCADALKNLANALVLPDTIDGNFAIGYIKEHRVGRVVVSGHSQGGYDISRTAPHLRAGDQLILLQPVSAALTPNENLLGAIARGVHVHVGFSPRDLASIGIRLLAGPVPLVEFPKQDGQGVHSTQNARTLLHRFYGVGAGRTVNPALDAVLLSNPGWSQDPSTFPAWAD